MEFRRVLFRSILILQGKLLPNEETRLIGDTMAMIGHVKTFKGIELAVISGNGGHGFFRKIGKGIANALSGGDLGAVTIIGPATIVKEIKRILKPGGVFCVGESVKLVTEVPQFVKDMYDNSGIAPLNINEFSKYFNERNFEILLEEDLSYTLKKYYKSWNDVLNENLKKLSDEEKQQNKKLIKRIGHESKAYNNLGGSKYMGFKMLILKKGNDEKR